MPVKKERSVKAKKVEAKDSSNSLTPNTYSAKVQEKMLEYRKRELDLRERERKSAERLNDELLKIKEDASDYNRVLDFDLHRKEIEIQNKKSALDAEYKAYEDSVQEALKNIEVDIKKLQDEHALKVKEYDREQASRRRRHEEQLEMQVLFLERELESKNYNHKMAIERKDEETMLVLAKELGFVVRTKEEDKKMLDELSKTEEYKDQAGKFTSLFNAEKSKHNEAVNKHFSELALLKAELAHAEKEVAKLNEENKTMREELNKVPSKITEVVAAARANINLGK